jgi:hypothetical protein
MSMEYVPQQGAPDAEGGGADRVLPTVRDGSERKHWLEYATGGFALVAAIGSVSAALVGYWQWGVLSGQLSAMRLEQRP